jgi:hypothetical protein
MGRPSRSLARAGGAGRVNAGFVSRQVCRVRHFHEKLQEEHGISLSYAYCYPWVKAGAAGGRAG